VEKFAACLGVSRHGLSPAELTALLDPGDPLGNVAALLRLLRPYLMRRGELLDFYHGQFREAAEAAYLDIPEKQRAAHEFVADCLQAFADPHRDGQCRNATPHALSELPHHQTRAEASPDLIATLENIFFLEAKVTHDMTFDLAEDFTAAVDALPPEHVERNRLRLLDEALRRDIHFIAHHADGLLARRYSSASGIPPGGMIALRGIGITKGQKDNLDSDRSCGGSCCNWIHFCGIQSLLFG
jgi:hypothetical protein